MIFVFICISDKVGIQIKDDTDFVIAHPTTKLEEITDTEAVLTSLDPAKKAWPKF